MSQVTWRKARQLVGKKKSLILTDCLHYGHSLLLCLLPQYWYYLIIYLINEVDVCFITLLNMPPLNRQTFTHTDIQQRSDQIKKYIIQYNRIYNYKLEQNHE